MKHRTDAELKAASPHVFWHLRQLLRLSAHLERRQREGRSVMTDALDAAVLEGFAVSARALVEFLWRDRQPGQWSLPREMDALAVDWFPEGGWQPDALPTELQRVRERVGWGVAHISFRRIDRDEEWGWRHLEIAHRIAYWFACFAQDVDADCVADDFRQEVEDEIIEWRKATQDETPFQDLLNPPGPVGTPMHPRTISGLRRAGDGSAS